MNFLNKKTFKKRGFTLIEMLIVIVIIGILASALIPRLSSARGKANDVARKADMQQIATAMISYQLDSIAGSFITQSGKVEIVLSGALKAGGLSTIPIEPQISTYTGLDGTVTSGYSYFPMTKNGSPNQGMLLMAKVEADSAGNFVDCTSSRAAVNSDIGAVVLCQSIASGAACGACTYNGDKATLRYVYKY